MNQTELIKQLIRHEGERLKPYLCTAGKTTIGVGRNLSDTGISKPESRILLKNDIKACVEDLSSLVFPHQFEAFPEPVQHVLINMRFQLGHRGFRTFKRMILAFQAYDYEGAIREMKDSKWYQQCQTRADDLIKMINAII